MSEVRSAQLEHILTRLINVIASRPVKWENVEDWDTNIPYIHGQRLVEYQLDYDTLWQSLHKALERPIPFPQSYLVWQTKNVLGITISTPKVFRSNHYYVDDVPVSYVLTFRDIHKMHITLFDPATLRRADIRYDPTDNTVKLYDCYVDTTVTPEQLVCNFVDNLFVIDQRYISIVVRFVTGQNIFTPTLILDVKKYDANAVEVFRTVIDIAFVYDQKGIPLWFPNDAYLVAYLDANQGIVTEVLPLFIPPPTLVVR